MDIVELIFIIMLCFVFASLVATLIFLFQSKTRRSERAFLKKSKEIPENNLSSSLASVDSNSKKSLILQNHSDAFKIMNKKLIEKDMILIPNVRYSDILSLSNKKVKDNKELYAQLPYLIADYAIFNLSDMLPIYVINDVSKEKNITNNQNLLDILQDVDIEIINIDGFEKITEKI